MTAKRLPERNRIPDADKWDLSPLFSSDNRWELLHQEVESELSGYRRYRGRLGESAALLQEAIEFHLAVSRRIERLFTYAHLKNDEDKSNPVYEGFFQKAIRLHTTASELSSFLVPEIQGIPDSVMAGFRKQKALTPYGFFLEKILREKPHTCEEKVEQVLAMSQEMAQAASQIFGQLDTVDLKFGTLTDGDGNRVELTHGNFITLLSSRDRSIRKRAFSRYYRSYDSHRHTLASALAHSIKKDLFYSRARNFESCRQAALFADDVPETMYDNLIETVRGNLDPLFEYLKFRKRALGLDTLHFYDTYVPIAGEERFRLPYEEAVQIAVQALAPLGRDYTSRMKEGLLGGWVDRYENRGKRNGAYSSGCFDSPPYILLNYEKDTINSLFTLVHEAGHSMHSYFSIQHQPYVDHQYTIFVAEVASTFNEILLGRYLIDRYRDDPKMQAYVLNREIDNIRATLFRQTMFAEFEKRTHAMAERGEPLTFESLSAAYRELLAAYFGDTLVIDDALGLEYLRIPHFYRAFYVYKYATGISAAIALARQLWSEGEAARNRYLQFLGLGGSRFPLEQLKEAGVDMSRPEPVREAIAHFSERVERLMQVYATLG